MTMKTTMVDEESGVIRSPVPAGASRRPDSGGDGIIVRMREHKDGTQKNFTTVARALKASRKIVATKHKLLSITGKTPSDS